MLLRKKKKKSFLGCTRPWMVLLPLTSATLSHDHFSPGILTYRRFMKFHECAKFFLVASRPCTCYSLHLELSLPHLLYSQSHIHLLDVRLNIPSVEKPCLTTCSCRPVQVFPLSTFVVQCPFPSLRILHSVFLCCPYCSLLFLQLFALAYLF